MLSVKTTVRFFMPALTILLLLSTLPLPAAQPVSLQRSHGHQVAIDQKPDAGEGSIHQMPGYPVVIEPHKPVSSHEELTSPSSTYGVVLADLDGRGGLELVYSTHSCRDGSCNRGRVWAWDSQGNALSGFPFTTIGSARFTPSIGDLDGDGDQEIVQLTENTISNTRLYVLDHLGNLLDGFPVIISHEAELTFGTILYDLDQDGQLEIICAAERGVHVVEIDGSGWDGWPLDGVPADGTPAIGDVDGDGDPEIFVKSAAVLHLLGADGSVLEGWPIEPEEDVFFSFLAAPVMADIDGDLDLELIVTAVIDGHGGWVEGEVGPAQVRVYHHDGTLAEGWPVGADHPGYVDCQSLVTDLEGDGELEVVFGSSLESEQMVLYAWDASGTLKPGFPVVTDQPGFLPTLLTAADIDGDGLMEVFSDSGNVLPGYDGEGYIFGFDAFGSQLPGFPLRPHGLTAYNGAIIGDVDGDGDYELAAVSVDRDNKVTHINLYDLPGSFASSPGDWLTYHGSNSRGGVLKRQYRGWRFVYAGGRRGR